MRRQIVANPNIGNDMIKIEQATRELGIKRATLYRYAQNSRLTTYRRDMDRHVYVRRSEVEELRRFRPVERPTGLNPSFIEAATAFQKRTFGDRILTTPSSELIEEGRRERDE